jgi:Cof subfamily protein (haloacid dehalogenase superfamily)
LQARDYDGTLRFELGAFDLDGTVLRRDLVITEATIGALDALREKGMRLVVATGRSFESALEHAGRLGFGERDPVICYGGSMVRTMGGETLLHHTLPERSGVEILEWAAERGLHARVFTDGRIAVPSDRPPDAGLLGGPSSSPPPNVFVVENLVEWLKNADVAPTKVVIVDQPTGVERWLDEAQDAFAGRLFVTRSLPHYVEVSSPEGTKSKALKFLCGLWGIDPANTLAFGDADNDIDMLRFAGLGVVVGGLNDEVRAAADRVARPVDEDGVARFVEEFVGGLLRSEGGR